MFITKKNLFRFSSPTKPTVLMVLEWFLATKNRQKPRVFDVKAPEIGKHGTLGHPKGIELQHFVNELRITSSEGWFGWFGLQKHRPFHRPKTKNIKKQWLHSLKILDLQILLATLACKRGFETTQRPSVPRKRRFSDSFTDCQRKSRRRHHLRPKSKLFQHPPTTGVFWWFLGILKLPESTGWRV